MPRQSLRILRRLVPVTHRFQERGHTKTAARKGAAVFLQILCFGFLSEISPAVAEEGNHQQKAIRNGNGFHCCCRYIGKHHQSKETQKEHGGTDFSFSQAPSSTWPFRKKKSPVTS